MEITVVVDDAIRERKRRAELLSGRARYFAATAVIEPGMYSALFVNAWGEATRHEISGATPISRTSGTSSGPTTL